MLRTTLATTLILTVTILMAAPRTKPAAPTAANKPASQVVYKIAKDADGKDVKLTLNMFYPPHFKPSDKRPAIVFFFGGGWNGGSPGQFTPQAQHFARRGFVCATADYRVRSRQKTSPFACAEDGRDAVRYLRKHATELGIDPAKIVASGGSAGGHVAACTGTVPIPTTEDNTVSARPCALILFNPVIDTSEKGYGNARFQDGNWKALSPVHHVSKDTPPTIIFHGTADKTVPFENVERFAAEMKKHGRPCTLVAIKGKGHGFFNYRRYDGKFFYQTMAKTETFLIGLGLLKGPALSVKQIRKEHFSAPPKKEKK